MIAMVLSLTVGVLFAGCMLIEAILGTLEQMKL